MRIFYSSLGDSGNEVLFQIKKSECEFQKHYVEVEDGKKEDGGSCVCMFRCRRGKRDKKLGQDGKEWRYGCF